MKESLKGIADFLNNDGLRQAFNAVYRGKGTPLQKKIVFGIPALAILFVMVVAFVIIPLAGSSSYTGERGVPVYFTVRPGMSVSEIGKELYERGIIDSEMNFWWTAKLNGFENKVKSGTFAMQTGMTPRDALEILVYGNTVTIRFTIPEGFSVRDIAQRLDDEGLVKADAFISLAKTYRPYPYVEEHENVRYAVEGFLFPDTYEINGEFDAARIMQMMAENFDRRLTKEMRDRAREMDLSIYELVTLASLVEKEAYHEEDRPIIAQIFLKRLRLGMPLQADPTVQYLLDAPKEDLLYRDTEIESPYNTYQNVGLPPGPIASPGTASLMAVLHPADTNYLYFVADRNGNNYYATNYADHLALVDQVR
ncbi:aminodeoxychorismate lyase [Centipeda periodontii DSM 2778]|uniref:Endolytic murein transglycosylase n=1 Tax=Centipeda periodontii DSM 2778 TaxID=888060 RepID=F5RLJ2_9FIRM|nr:endolytic transglycosylase MltG [Centipeda periodontii]EGK60115.1 aminodeoxychorismate lyase [Centipeda periodontii DSM 2778]